MLIGQFSVLFFVLSFVGSASAAGKQPPSTAKIEKTECSDSGYKIHFSDGRKMDASFPQNQHEKCESIKISDDKKAAVIWTKCTGEALNGNGTAKDENGTEYQAACASLFGILVEGARFFIEEHAGFIRDVHFKKQSHRVQYIVGPLHGPGTTAVLYDLDQRQRVATCSDISDANKPKCPAFKKE